jgi:hypothetical protein
VTFSLGREYVGNSTNATGTVKAAAGYAASDSVVSSLCVSHCSDKQRLDLLARRRAIPAATSNKVFAVDWRWDAVPGAEGYRLLRNVNSGGFNDATDVVGTNVFSDVNNAWIFPTTVTPTNTQTGPSIQWNPTVGNLNNLPGQWGCLESINFVIDDPTTRVHSTFTLTISRTAQQFSKPSKAPSPAPRTMASVPRPSPAPPAATFCPHPIKPRVSNGAADTGNQVAPRPIPMEWRDRIEVAALDDLWCCSCRQPICQSGRSHLLPAALQPVGSTPVAPPRPALSISLSGSNAVLNWTDAHNLQAATNVSGTYSNIPGVILGPYTDTNTPATGQRFFRLAN